MNRPRHVFNYNQMSASQSYKRRMGTFFAKFRYGFLTLCVLWLTVSGYCLEIAPSFDVAPKNPEFSSYFKNISKSKGLLQWTESGHRLSHIPNPVDLSHVRRLYKYFNQAKQNRALTQAAAYPSKYDLRTTGKLTPVKDQGSCGNCWAYATFGSLESYLMPAENWDFSEEDISSNSGFDPGPCDGGNVNMAMAYLSRYSGPIREGDPITGTVQKHIQKVEYIPRTQYTYDEIKQAILSYGAVTTAIGWYDTAYQASTNSYYYNGTGTENHNVVIVGWDDTYSKSNFKTPAPNDGAFIIRNSWGADWGDGGYFYMSYYDTYAGNGCWVFDNAESPTNFSTIYQNDLLGCMGSLGARPAATTAWGANIFTAVSSDPLKAVAFYALSPNMAYEINIYTNVSSSNPTSGALVHTQSGTLTNVGYVTIPLNSPVSVVNGALFSIVVKFQSPGYYYPVPIEEAIRNYSSNVVNHLGKGFFSGSGQSWTEVSTSTYKYNICIKAFSGQVSQCTPDLKVNGQKGPVTVSAGTPINMSAALSAGDQSGLLADWWIVCSAPWGWCSLDANGWTAGVNLLMQYPLFDFPDTSILYGTLPAGDYTFYFIVDMTPDGAVDLPFYYDMAQVHIVN